MAVGLTDAGFVARQQSEIEEELIARLQSDDDLAGLNFRAGPMHQIVAIVAELLAQAWEAAEEVYGSQYATASGVSLDRVAELTGTRRRAATRSTVSATCNLAASTTLPAGSIAAVDGSPDSQFRSVEVATNALGVAANVAVLFESVETGPVAAPSGTLTVIPSPVTGWNTITNAADADLGALVADDAELREARLVELAGAGSATTAAIRAALARVTGVEEVSVYQNVTSGTVAGRPPKSIEAVIWDGVSFVADDDEIAQAIWDSVAAGIEVYGDADSGVATDAGTGETFVVDFTRATVLRLYVDATIALKPGTATGWADEVNAAIVARGQAYGVGEDVYASHLSCAVQALDFVEGVADLRVGTSPSPTGFSTEIGETEIAGIDSADVTVSEAL